MRFHLWISIQFILILLQIFTPGVIAQVPELPEFDDAIYYGYEYGTAGISSALLSVLSSNILEVRNDEIMISVERGLNFIWENRLEYQNNKLPTWGKNTENDLIYPSKKYGAAGIIPAFLNYYNFTKNEIWLERAETAYWELVKQQVSNGSLPNWAYAYSYNEFEGIPISDLKFGSAGILEANLDLYDITENIAYLDHAKQIIKWLEMISTTVSISTEIFRIIPWYYIEGSMAPIMLSYGWGNAGIAPLLYKYGSLTNNSTIKDWSLEIGRFLAAAQLDNGGWKTELDGMTIVSGRDNGVAGIVYSLNLLQSYSETELFEHEITAGINYLFSQIVNNATVFGFYEDSQGSEISNGYNSGFIGILDVLSKLVKYTNREQDDLISQGIQWMISVGSFVLLNENDQLLFGLKSPKDKNIVDFSFSDGMAGYLHVFQNLRTDEAFNLTVNLNITKVIEGLTLALVHFQSEEGYWVKQRSFENIPRESFLDYTFIGTNQTSSKTSDTPFLFGSIIVFIVFRKSLVLKKR